MRKAIFVFLLMTIAAAAQSAPAKPAQAAPGAATKPGAAAAKPATATAPTLLPSKSQIDAAMQRTFGYDPGITWNVLDVRESPIAGVAEILVSINKQPPLHLFVPSDMQNAIAGGEMIPFGADPFAPAREKLKAADGHSRGPQKPVVEMVEFSDLECPHCKAAQPILEKLAGDFPQVRYTFQQFPLVAIHPWAMKAAKYAECAAQQNKEAFWKFTDSVFENQGGIALATADDKLQQLATATGLDAAKLAACAATAQAEAQVNKSLELGQALDVTQTPTVFINGRRVVGIANIPYEQLKSLVQFEIDHAGK